ncbi:hypothetical protein B0H19DRAFT_1275361 [Mycena capillaripes]|nr:hypothetical protein B0H19DRAFT_1275361 [Mycena capillaripes]
MPPKRKLADTLLDSGSESDSASTSDSSNSSHGDAEDENVYYESMSRDAQGRTVYKASLLSFAVPEAPSVLPTAPTTSAAPGKTWIYDFMDNDWTFPGDQIQPDDDEQETPPASPTGSGSSSSSSESEPEGPTKREPVYFFPHLKVGAISPFNQQYRPVRKWKEKYCSLFLDEVV